MRKRFGIDIDGTVTCPTTFLPFINKSFNLQLTIHDMKEYDLIPLIGITEDEFWKWMDETEPLIYKHAPLSAHAKHVLDLWKNEHELLYISARRDQFIDVTKEWFADNAIHYNGIELIGSHDKIKAVKKHGINIFFEDKHDNACDISEECDIPVILFNTPYNQDSVPKNVIRVNDWLEANKYVENLFAKINV